MIKEKIVVDVQDYDPVSEAEKLAKELDVMASEYAYADLEKKTKVTLMLLEAAKIKGRIVEESVAKATLLTEAAMIVLEQAKQEAQESADLAAKIKRMAQDASRVARDSVREKNEAQALIEITQQAQQEVEDTCNVIGAELAEIEAYMTKAPIQKISEKKKLENDGTMVTVICVSFRHEKYIAQAMDSFLMQKTEFKFKVFVGEDCGGDGTADIIRAYAEKYPDIIIPFIREQNMGPQRNGLDMCEQATSPYIAFCDGDDYWTDEYKLQKQFDYMEAHPDYRFSFARTEVIPTENWPHANYYKVNADGRYIMPDYHPGYTLGKAPLTAKDFIAQSSVGHSSTFFVRWNYDIKFPNWFYEGVLGDKPLKLIQLGAGKAGYIEDIVSAYRVNETGVFSKYKNSDEMFVRTRIEYIRVFTGLLRWYEDNGVRNYPKVMIQNRIIREANNLIDSALRIDEYDAILDVLHQYPEAGKLLLGYFSSANKDRRMLEGALGWTGYQVLVRNKWFRNSLRPYGKFANKALKFKNSAKVKKLKSMTKNIASLLSYWFYTPVSKQKNLWVVSGFRKNTYMDNTRYFYEYVLKNHPEIEIYWATVSKDLYNTLRREGKPVLLMRTWACTKKISRASIAVVDHYAVADFERLSGFNDRTKVVQLWHGVGFKSATAKDGSTTTGEPGVRSSSDILAQPEDGLMRRIGKKFKYIRHAYYRELYEKYFLFLTPGEEMINRMGKPWGIPEKSYFISGYPRLEPMYDAVVDWENPKILYAPTYRWDPKEEAKVVQGFLDVCQEIQNVMEETNGTFVLRMHPHTWRNYQTKIARGISKYDRIDYDTEKDVYNTLGTYTVVISDYSSIAVDFATLNRPTIYFCPDYDVYTVKDTGLVADFKDQITGPFTETWEETFTELKEYVNAPKKDQAWANVRCNYFYRTETTDAKNTGRIVDELKLRLKM